MSNNPSIGPPTAATWIPVDYQPRRCKECGRVFKPIRVDQEFDTPECRKIWHKKASRRGGQAYQALMLWRKSRGRKKGLLGDVTALVDRWIDEDRRSKSS